MKKTTLSDVSLNITDGKHGDCVNEENSGFYFISCKDVKDDAINYESARQITEKDFSEANKRTLLEPNDILITNSGTIGRMAFVRDVPSTYKTTFQKSVAIVKPNSDIIYPLYLYYQLQCCVERFINQSNGSAQKNLLLSTMRAFELFIHDDLNTQRRIADILSAYDGLIENNRKQIKLLEEAAQRLYKEWFVDLRFPGHEHTKIVDGVPEGWDRMPVGSLIGKVDRTKQIPTSEYLPNGKIPVIDQSREFIAGYTNDVQAIVKSKAPIIVFGDHTRILKLVQFPFAKGADGTQLIISASERMPQRLLYCSLMNIDLSNYHYARHFKYLKSEIILLPSKGIADDFEKITDPVFKKIQSCRDQCCWGQEARDRLLPKLMSGEVEV